jgi:hypothetical protein
MWRDTALALLALPLALAAAPLALGLGAVWLVWRLGVYLTAKTAAADIIGWTGDGDPQQIDTAVARPHLRFTDAAGVEQQFTSRIGFNIYDDPPPTGALPVRYHIRPFSAEIDDRGHWFTGPCLTIALALVGSFIAATWRTILGAWL